MRHGIMGAALALALSNGFAASSAGADEAVKRGEYLVHIMDCVTCHTPGGFSPTPDTARLLAGGDAGFEMPDLGVFYPPNLTPDVETGLGAWSEADIVKAIRTGERPDGRVLVPIMPWVAYARLTDADADAIAAFLKSMAPIANKPPAPVGLDETPTAPFWRITVPQ